MSAKKSQRLINLFAKLIYSKYSHPTWTEIADELEGYGDPHSDTAKRMFERDKDILRKFGIPVKSDCDDDGEHRYYIDGDDYYLPALSLTDEEFTIVGLAIQFMQSVPALPFRQDLPGAALKMTFGPGGSIPPPGNEFRIVLGDEPVEKYELFDLAASRGKRISFLYRGIGDSEPRKRTIETYNRFYRHGAWYITGRCLSSMQTRTFRMDRIAGAPEIVDDGSNSRAYDLPGSTLLNEFSDRYFWQGEDGVGENTLLATLILDRGTPHSHLRRLKATEGLPTEVRIADRAVFIDWLIGLGISARLTGPSELILALTAKLEQVIDSFSQTPAAHDFDSESPAAAPSAMTQRNSGLEVKITDQFERLLILLPYLINNPGIAVRDVCKQFGLSRKELLSDLDLISMCGLPPYSPDAMIDCQIDDDDSIEILMADYLSRPARLTPGQATSLLISLESLASSPMIRDRKVIEGLVSKIRGLVNYPGGASADAGTLPVWLDIDPGATEEIVSIISRALTDHIEITINYFAADGTGTTRAVQPYSTVCFAGNWYLIAYCHLRGTFRTFRVDRIRSAVPGEVRFTPDWASVPEHLREGELFSSAGETQYHVVIEASHRVALLARPFSQIQPRSDELYTIAIDTPSLDWIVPLILQWGSEIRIVAPAELSRMAAGQAKKILALYNQVPAQ